MKRVSSLNIDAATNIPAETFGTVSTLEELIGVIVEQFQKWEGG